MYMNCSHARFDMHASLSFLSDFCRSVQQVVPRPDIPTALMFYTTPSSVAGAPTLAVGTNRGSVLLVRSDLTTVSLNQR